MSFSVATTSPSQPSGVDSEPETVITTTIFAGATSSAAPAASPTDVPIAAIAGGAAAGVFLAIAAVLLWHWWGWSIKRKEDEERREAFAILQLRENTRQNASSLLMQNYTTYRPSFSSRQDGRKVKFVAHDSSNAKLVNEKGKYVPYTNVSASEDEKKVCEPRDTSPQPQLRVTTCAEVTRPPPVRISQSDSPSNYTSRGANRRTTPEPLESQSLAHKSSTVSSSSMYSTQSGEEHQLRVPSSLIMAALGRLDLRRPLSATYRRSARHSAATSDDLNRLSQISAGSAYLQIPSDPSETPIGLAR